MPQPAHIGIAVSHTRIRTATRATDSSRHAVARTCPVPAAVQARSHGKKESSLSSAAVAARSSTLLPEGARPGSFGPCISRAEAATAAGAAGAVIGAEDAVLFLEGDKTGLARRLLGRRRVGEIMENEPVPGFPGNRRDRPQADAWRRLVRENSEHPAPARPLGVYWLAKERAVRDLKRGGCIVRIVWFLGFIVCLAITALPAFGQGVNGTITGTVTDPSGSVVSGAAMEAANVETGAHYTAASTNTGNYAIPNVPVGSYTVTAKVPGFKTYTHTNLAIAAVQVLREDVSLQVGSAAESVTVSAEASLLKTESGETAHNITLKEMDELPLLGIRGGYRHAHDTSG